MLAQKPLLLFFDLLVYLRRSKKIEAALPYRNYLRSLGKSAIRAYVKSFVGLVVRVEAHRGKEMLVPLGRGNRLPRAFKVTPDDHTPNPPLLHTRDELRSVRVVRAKLHMAVRVNVSQIHRW